MSVYGRGGVGKTMLVATLPGKVALGSVESGTLSLSKQNQKRVFGTSAKAENDLQVFELETLDDLVQFHEWMQEPDCPFDSIALDSVTEIADKVLANSLAQVKDPRQAYGALMSQVVDIFWKFRDGLPNKHILFVMQQTPNKDGGVPLHIPLMPGNKMSAKVPYLFDELFHMDIGSYTEGETTKTYRFLRTQPSLEYDAKDRSGALDEKEAPDLSAIIEKILA